VTELLLLILFLIGVALIFRVDFIVYVVYVLIGVFAVSRWYVPRSLARVKVERRFHHRTFFSEPVEIEVHVKNPSRLPVLWLQLIESVPPELGAGPAVNSVIHLGPRGERRLAYQVRAMKRGYYRLGPMNLIAGDLFGFKETQVTLRSDFLTVYPRIIPLDQLMLPSRLPFGTLASRQRLFEDPARPHGVRDYRLGDSLRLVNWKVSAHSDDLLVRTFQPAISLESSILLNLNTDDYSRRFRLDGPEWAIVVAASVASNLVAHRQAVGLVSNGLDPLLQPDLLGDEDANYETSSGRLMINKPAPDGHEQEPQSMAAADLVARPIPPKPGRDQLMQILERLARLEGAATHNFASFAIRATKRLNWGVTLIVVAPDADTTLSNTLHQLVRAGFNVVLLVIEPYSDFASVRERARLLGFHAYHVPDRRSLRRWQKAGARVN
jgi:uncharacterized protein (DUF58 family)